MDLGMLDCVALPAGGTASSGLKCVCMTALQLGVHTPGIEHALGIEGLFQFMVNPHQNIAERREHSGGPVGAPDHRGVSTPQRGPRPPPPRPPRRAPPAPCALPH